MPASYRRASRPLGQYANNGGSPSRARPDPAQLSWKASPPCCTVAPASSCLQVEQCTSLSRSCPRNAASVTYHRLLSTPVQALEASGLDRKLTPAALQPVPQAPAAAIPSPPRTVCMRCAGLPNQDAPLGPGQPQRLSYRVGAASLAPSHPPLPNAPQLTPQGHPPQFHPTPQHPQPDLSCIPPHPEPRPPRVLPTQPHHAPGRAPTQPSSHPVAGRGRLQAPQLPAAALWQPRAPHPVSCHPGAHPECQPRAHCCDEGPGQAAAAGPAVLPASQQVPRSPALPQAFFQDCEVPGPCPAA